MSGRSSRTEQRPFTNRLIKLYITHGHPQSDLMGTTTVSQHFVQAQYLMVQGVRGLEGFPFLENPFSKNRFIGNQLITANLPAEIPTISC